MNIIFLDVDGVLNSVNHLIKVYNETHKSHSGYDYPFDPNCLENLRELVIKTNSSLVICSTWRHSQEGMKKLLSVLSEYELDKLVIGCTPSLGLSRGLEIKKYISNNQAEMCFFRCLIFLIYIKTLLLLIIQDYLQYLHSIIFKLKHHSI